MNENKELRPGERAGLEVKIWNPETLLKLIERTLKFGKGFNKC